MKAQTPGCVKRPGGQTAQIPRIPTGKPGIASSTRPGRFASAKRTLGRQAMPSPETAAFNSDWPSFTVSQPAVRA